MNSPVNIDKKSCDAADAFKWRKSVKFIKAALKNKKKGNIDDRTVVIILEDFIKEIEEYPYDEK